MGLKGDDRPQLRGAGEEERVELRELAAPVLRRPVTDAARPAEVAVVVRPDLVSVAVGERELPAHRRDPRRIGREADRRVAAGKPRR